MKKLNVKVKIFDIRNETVLKDIVLRRFLIFYAASVTNPCFKDCLVFSCFSF